MLLLEKFRIEGTRARARLQGATDLPGSCDKMRGAEILSAAAGSASRSSAACDSRTRTRSENIPTTPGPPCNDALGGAARARTATAAGLSSSAHKASASVAARYSGPAATRARRPEQSDRSFRRGLVRPRTPTDGRKDPASRRGGRSARALTAASARRPLGTRVPGCSAPWSASSPTCRASA